ncbi:TIGR03862 family flavoprotein [Rhodobacteraceae bacterium RKSG542]|uniref:NAD(P)/FAD-dependent oxidoreductase n=1 Tax=Pseudovibrio flavus TaxID=2529854 RepID=UPI0012BCF189|nr:TIGR03862 family flavoprotein [Pseudovibrio flavus]MTI17092.1 TIGR03862 family flavoprotein [Pseudovibrio flavus]
MPREVAIIGAGPAGLFAAEILGAHGYAVTIYEHMPSPARKFLMAGRGGLNLTHSEPLDAFLKRYEPQNEQLLSAISTFPPQALREWCHGLGQPTFVGSSGRVFPESFKASPLVRAWLQRLTSLGVKLETRVRWVAINEDGAPVLQDTDGNRKAIAADAVFLGLGGASWAKLGSDAAWVPMLEAKGISIAKFRPANCGFDIQFSPFFQERFAGQPLKRIALAHNDKTVKGEAMVDPTGLEGNAIYALSSSIRNCLEQNGSTEIILDLRPDLSLDELSRRLSKPKGKQSLSNHLRKATGLSPVAIALLREAGPLPTDAKDIAQRIKSLTLTVTGAKPLERSISSAGGVCWEEIEANFMLKKLQGYFVAGEMMDWEAPTGGYLLQGVFATARAAALAIDAHLSK